MLLIFRYLRILTSRIRKCVIISCEKVTISLKMFIDRSIISSTYFAVVCNAEDGRVNKQTIEIVCVDKDIDFQRAKHTHTLTRKPWCHSIICCRLKCVFFNSSWTSSSARCVARFFDFDVSEPMTGDVRASYFHFCQLSTCL